ncbi:MAG: NAD(P)-dependent alcohol dehydrogenase [Candidatus Limnocylindrales bacterium]
MRAIIQPRYGGPESIELSDEPRPSPKSGEVLVRVRASSVNAADIEVLDGFAFVRMASPLRPAHRIVGSDIAGVVEEVGADVRDIQTGDSVMGDLSEHGFGAFAEYAVAPAEALCRLPSGLAVADAAAVPSAAWVSIKAARDLEPGQRVLVNGGGGAMGSFAIQMARAKGAHVTAVDSAAKLELLRDLGADEVVDYRARDVTASDERYDFVLDVIARRSVRDWQRILNPSGRYRMVGGSAFRILAGYLQGQLIGRSSEQDLGLLMGWPHTRQDMEEVNGLIEAGLVRPAIGHRFPLEEAAAALRTVKDGRSMGKVLIDIET